MKRTITAIFLFLAFTFQAHAYNVVKLNPAYVPNPIKGVPISLGKIYVGVADADPTVVANQIDLYVQEENGTITAVSQPVTLGAGGVPLYNGSPVSLLVEGNYSLAVLSSTGAQVYYIPSDQDVVKSYPSGISLDDAYACDLADAVAGIGVVDITTLKVDCDPIIAEGTTVTVTSNIAFEIENGSIIDGVAGGGTETLVINGGLTAGLYQVFGSDLTVSGAPLITESYPEWFGSITPAIAFMAINGGTVRLSGDTYNESTSIIAKNSVSIIGSGLDSSIINYTGSGQAFVANEGISRVRYENFQITNAANGNSTVDGMVFNYGLSRSVVRIKYIAKGGDTSDGIVIHGTRNNDGATANNNQYGNQISCYTSASSEVTGIALWLSGADVSNARANGNIMQDGVYDGFTTGIKINGNGNTLISPTINGPCTASAAIYLEGDGTYGNTVINPYLDAGITGDKYWLKNTAISGMQHMVSIIDGVNETAPFQIIDKSTAGGTATYRLQSRWINWFPTPAAETNNPANGYATGVIGNSPANTFHVSADDDYTAGGIVMSGPTLAAASNAMAIGGVSARINATTGEFKVVKTTNGSTFTPLFSVLANGCTRLGYSPNTIDTCFGSGSPEGVVTAPPGSVYRNYSGTATEYLQYDKKTGTGNTGWVGVGTQY